MGLPVQAHQGGRLRAQHRADAFQRRHEERGLTHLFIIAKKLKSKLIYQYVLHIYIS